MGRDPLHGSAAPVRSRAPARTGTGRDSADLVRADALAGYRAAVCEIGGDPDALLRRIGMELEEKGQGAQFVPYQKMAALLHETAKATGRPDFGLYLAARQGGLSVLGPLEVAMRNSPTLGDAFSYYMAHSAAFSPAVSIALEKEDETGRLYFRFEMFLDRLRNAQQVAEHAMALLHHIVIAMSGGRARSRELWFAHGPQSPMAAYRRYFGTRVEMNMPFAALFLHREDLAVPLPDSAPTLFNLANAFIDNEYPMRRPLSAQVRSILTRILADGRISKKDVAHALSLHPKTLDRRLRAEDTGFRALLEEVRRDAAQRYLTETVLPITQVASMLGYCEPAVLSRNCRRWFGCTPRGLRSQRETSGS